VKLILSGTFNYLINSIKSSILFK